MLAKGVQKLNVLVVVNILKVQTFQILNVAFKGTTKKKKKKKKKRKG
jgi:hypothetical protein